MDINDRSLYVIRKPKSCKMPCLAGSLENRIAMQTLLRHAIIIIFGKFPEPSFMMWSTMNFKIRLILYTDCGEMQNQMRCGSYTFLMVGPIQRCQFPLSPLITWSMECLPLTSLRTSHGYIFALKFAFSKRCCRRISSHSRVVPVNTKDFLRKKNPRKHSFWLCRHSPHKLSPKGDQTDKPQASNATMVHPPPPAAQAYTLCARHPSDKPPTTICSDLFALTASGQSWRL